MALRPDLEEQRAIKAALARKSLAHFFRQSWHVLEPATPLVWGWHLQAIADHLQALVEGRIPCRNLIVNVPPGSSKSRLASVCLCAWRWIDHPEWRAIFTSANPTTAMRDSRYCRQIIESAWYQETFRPTWSFARDQNAIGIYANTAEGFRQSFGSGANPTGARANHLGMDDMVAADEGESKAARDAFKLFYDQAFANRVSDMTTSTRSYIGQRLAEDDPPGHLLASGDWELLKIRQTYRVETPKRVTSLGWSDPRTIEGEPMDPVRFPAEELAKERRRLGSRGWSAQQQQDPSPASGAIIKREWLKSYRTPSSGAAFLPPLLIVKALGITRLLSGWDTALAGKQSSDNTACIVLGEAPSRYYVLDYYCEKVEFPVGKAAIVAMHAKWRTAADVVEGGSSASGKATVQAIKLDTNLPVIEMPVHSDKVTAMNAISPTVEAGTVYIPDDQPWSAALVDDLVKFPAGEHDDVADAFRIVLAYATQGGGSIGWLEMMRHQAAARATGQERRTA